MISVKRISDSKAFSTGKRYFSPVKAVDWSNPNRVKGSLEWSRKDERSSKPKLLAPPFGIIAAVSNNRVIGLQGSLPWKIPEDREHFYDITKGKILVLGRKSFQENPKELSHVHKCVVISKTMNAKDYDNSFIEIASSFNEALMIAYNRINDGKEIFPEGINCIVAGGERIYEQAVSHPQARELHLTKVYINIELGLDSGRSCNAAFFPQKYRWDTKFIEVGKRKGNTNAEYEYEFFYFKKRK